MSATGSATARPSGVVGLDIGGTKVSGLLLDEQGNRLGVARVQSRPGAAGVLGAALECIEVLTADAGIGELRPRAVGVGVPGVVDAAAGTVANAVNLGIDTEPFALGPLLAERLGGPTARVENDVNVAAVGAARTLGVDDVAFLSLGTGVAAGIVLQGRLLRGHLGVAGEIGHVSYVVNGPVCACGQRGCLELYSSGAALTLAWNGRGGAAAGTDVFTAAARGDRAARRIRDDYAKAVATCVQMLVLACGVRTVMIGGGVADAGLSLQDAVVGELAARSAASPFLAGLGLPERVVLAVPGDETAALGAALLATDTLPEPLKVTV